VTTVEVLDKIRDWLNVNVCSQIKLKKPSDDDVERFELVNPVAFSAYYPVRKVRDPRAGAPSIVVMFDEASDNGQSYTLPIRLVFCIYSPGFHSPAAFIPDSEGWRDLLNFIDLAKAAILRSQNLDGISVGLPLTQGLAVPEEQTPGLEPYYFGYITFTAITPSYPRSDFASLI